MHLAAQVLPQLVPPVGLTLLLALAGVAPRRRWLVLLALALLWVASSDLTARAPWRAVESGQERTLASDAPSADAVVVLSSRRPTAPGDAGLRGWDTAEEAEAVAESMRRPGIGDADAAETETALREMIGRVVVRVGW